MSAKTFRRLALLCATATLLNRGPFVRAQESNSPLVATVDGMRIEQADVDRLAAPLLWPVQRRLYQIERQAVEALIQQRLLEREAARRAIPVEALIEREVSSKTETVGDADVERARSGSKEYQALSPAQLKAKLQKDKLAARLRAFVGSLERESAVRIVLESPAAPRSMLEPADAPVRGAQEAPITIVEFADFHCPFCQQAERVLKDVAGRSAVRLVHRDFPIDSAHPQARASHEAARCAGEQDQFWAFHDRLFSAPPVTAPDQLKAIAAETGLDADAFNQCVASGKYRKTIEKDVAEGKRLGVTATPTVFINGRELEGSLTVDSLSAAIQRETARARQ